MGSNVTAYSGADGDGSGIVDQADYGVWRAHFGLTLATATETGTSDIHDECGAGRIPNYGVVATRGAVHDPDCGTRCRIAAVSTTGCGAVPNCKQAA